MLNCVSEYGPAIIDHILMKAGYLKNVKLGKGFDISQVNKIVEALQEAEKLLDTALSRPSKASIIDWRLYFTYFTSLTGYTTSNKGGDYYCKLHSVLCD